jgi:hypothetical protein
MPMENADRVMSVAEAHKLDKPERLQWLPPDLNCLSVGKPFLRFIDVIYTYMEAF